MSQQERTAASNGLWTCQSCSKLIDSDVTLYTEGLLRRWKVDAEYRAAQMIATGSEMAGEPLDLAIPSLNSEESLLSYASVAIQQVGRIAEMAELRAFLDDDQPYSWWLWTGAAGVGKSRLAVDFCRSVSAEWHAGFLREPQQFLLAGTRTTIPTLVVVDYAAQRSEWLSDALFTLTQRPHNAKLRVLVLERAASGPWWQTVQRPHRLEEAEYVGSASYGLPRELGGLTRSELQSLIVSIATRVGADLSATNVEDISDHAEEIDPQRSPLFAYVATLDWLDANGVSAGRDAALRRLVARAQSQLTSRLCDGSTVSKARNVQALATALGGIDVRRYDEILESGPTPSGLLPGVHEDLLSVSLEDLLDGLRPDILGELFILDRVAADGVEGLATSRLLRMAWKVDPAGYTAFVERAIGDHVEHSHLVDLLKVYEDGDDPLSWAALAAGIVPLLRSDSHPALNRLLEQLDQVQLNVEDEDLDELVVTAKFRAANLVLTEDPARANNLFTALLAEAKETWTVRASILNNRGISWSQLGRPELAIDDYDAVIRSMAASDEIRACSLNNRADISDQGGDQGASIADRTAVLALSNTTYNRRFIALVRRARTQFHMGDRDGAFEDVDSILATDDIVPEQKMAARLQRAEWLISSGFEADAAEDLRAVLTSRRNFEDVVSRAKLLLAKLCDADT